MMQFVGQEVLVFHLKFRVQVQIAKFKYAHPNFEIAYGSSLTKYFEENHSTQDCLYFSDITICKRYVCPKQQ